MSAELAVEVQSLSEHCEIVIMIGIKGRTSMCAVWSLCPISVPRFIEYTPSFIACDFIKDADSIDLDIDVVPSLVDAQESVSSESSLLTLI